MAEVKMIGKSEYAKHRGCTPAAVLKAIRTGRITTVERDGQTLIDPEVADIQWANNTRARGDSARKPGAVPGVDKPGQPPADDGADDYKDHRARREKAEADRAEVIALREQQQVLMREPAERAIFDAFRALRDTAFQAMRDAAPKVRDLTESREIQLVLEEELRRAFAAFDAATRKRLAELAAEARP
jgi:hypothetical protein